MHLLFINRWYYPDQSATSRLLTDAAEGLARQGLGVTVLAGRCASTGESRTLCRTRTQKRVVVRRIWSTQFGRRSKLGRLADYLTFYFCAMLTALFTRRIDCLIVLSDPPMLSVVGSALGRARNWKTVCWLQDVFPEIAFRAGVLKEGWPGKGLRKLAQCSLRASHRVIVVGRCMEQHLLKLGIPKDRIALIPNWADGDELAPVPRNRNRFREHQKLDERIVVMYSGNLGVVHDTDSLVAVACHLRTVPGALVLIVGGGVGKARLERLVCEQGLNNVRFLGYQDPKILRHSLSAADVHVVTLRKEMEGLSVPSKVYGIMAVSRPVVFIGPGGSEVAHLIKEAECGLIFDPVEREDAAVAIRDLALDPQRREKLGASGLNYFWSHLEKRHALDRFPHLLQGLER